MADLKVRNLDDRVASSLKARAAERGVSLEEEVRATLGASVSGRRLAFARRAAAIRRSTAPPADASLDSVNIIRAERDARG